MDATPAQIDALRKLQELDRTRIQAASALTKLPQPAQAAEIRKKLEALAVKIGQVRSLRDDVVAQINAINDEDERLVVKQQQTQAEIEQSSDDYRKVATLTRDLEGAAKRRETLEFELGKATTKLDEIEALLAQALAGRDALAQQEQTLAEDYRHAGGALKAQMEAALSVRDAFLAQLPQPVASDYQRVLDKCGGVALAEVNGSSCSACRSLIDANRALQMKKEAPLSHCPSCGRIVILE